MAQVFQGNIHLKLNKRHTLKLLAILARINPNLTVERKKDINTHQRFFKVSSNRYWFIVTSEKGIKAFIYSNFSKENFSEKYRAINTMLKWLSGKRLETAVLKALKPLLMTQLTKDGAKNIILLDNKITPQNEGYNDIVTWLSREDN